MIKKIIFLIIALLVIVVAALVILWKLNLLPIKFPAGESYQAVFLTNNQVYFGKLSKADSTFPVLRDIYYLQVTQVLQPRPEDQPVQRLQLVKLGNELHGPEDEMKINREQILFIEDLKADSQVVKAIQEYKQSLEEQQ